MTTYEKVKENILKEQNEFLSRIKSKSLTEKDEFDRIVSQKSIRQIESHIENIDEVTLIEIGVVTNNIIEFIQRAYKQRPQEYFTNFELFIEKLFGLTNDGKRNNFDGFSIPYGQYQCAILGITLEDLMVFKGRDPRSNETCDLFKQRINDNFGTTIPMSEEIKQAEEEYDSARLSDDVAEKDKALIRLLEAKRNLGISAKNGGAYFPLATNEVYQEAKKRSSMTI